MYVVVYEALGQYFSPADLTNFQQLFNLPLQKVLYICTYIHILRSCSIKRTYIYTYSLEALKPINTVDR